MEIKDRIKQVTSRQLGLGMERLTDDATFADDLGADSLDLVEMVMAIENEFNIEIPDNLHPDPYALSILDLTNLIRPLVAKAS